MNTANITRRELLVKALGSSVVIGILTVFLFACDQPMQPRGGANGRGTEAVAIPSIILTPPIEAGESLYPAQIVFMITGTPEARIFYTTDGSPPNSSSREYRLFQLGTLGGGPKTIKAIATKPGLAPSGVRSLDVDVPLPSVTFSHGGEELPSGGITDVRTIDRLTISTNSPGTLIRYTAGSPGIVGPSNNAGERYDDTNKPRFLDLVSGQTGEYPREVTIKAIATSAGLTSETVIRTFSVSDRFVTAIPTFIPARGRVATTDRLTIGNTTDGATIYYSTDGSPPTGPGGRTYDPNNKPLFSSLGTGDYPRTITIRAIAVKSDFTPPNSEPAETTFTVQTPAARPTFSPANGDVAYTDILTISSTTEGATIHYTTDGSTPTPHSPLFGTTALEVVFSDIGSGEKTIKAIAVHAGHANSALAETTFTVPTPVARPTFSPASGRVATTGRLTIETSTDDATIRYTTDGSTPTGPGGRTYDPNNKPLFSSLGTGDYPRSLTIKAIAVKAGNPNSAEASTTFTVQTLAVTPTIRPENENVETTDSLDLSTSTSGATIRYTTDGSTPTGSDGRIYDPNNKPLFSSLRTGAGRVTITAIAVATGHQNSLPATKEFTVSLSRAATPTFSPGSGMVVDTDTLTITSTDGSTIYYTTNGSTPSTGPTNPSSSGSSPLRVSFGSSGIGGAGDYTIKAIAVKTGYTNSAEASTTFTVRTPVATPTFSPASGRVATTGRLTISSATGGATIRYTTDGSTPTGSDGRIYDPGNKPLFSSLGTGDYPRSLTIKAIAVKAGNPNSAEASTTFTVQTLAVTPTIRPENENVETTDSLDLSTSTSGATIRYTTDGSTPTGSDGRIYDPENKPLFSSLRNGAGRVTITAIAVATGHQNSLPATKEFTVSLLRAATPTFNPGSGMVVDTDTLTITSTDGSTIYYTTNGSTPSTGPTNPSSSGSSPLRVSFGSSGIGGAGDYTIKAIAVKTGYTNSAEASTTFAVRTPVATPTFSPSSGRVATTGRLTISSATGGATIRYTTDGSTPTGSDGRIYDPGNKPLFSSLGTGDYPRSLTIKAIAVKAGNPNSAEASTTFTVQTLAVTPTIRPENENVETTDSLDLSTTTSEATIRYTTDGSTPTDSGMGGETYDPGNKPLFSSLRTGAGRVTITAIAVATGHQNSLPATKEFTVSLLRAATPIFSPEGGTGSPVVSSTSSLTITSTDGSTIYYTTNGSTPSTGPTNPSSSGSSPLMVSFGSSGIGGAGDYTIRAIAVKTGYTNSAEASTTFTVAYDVDADNDGLIEIRNLDMLDNIRNNLAGTSYDDDSTDEGMSTDGGSTTGASTPANAAPDYMCTGSRTTSSRLCGYELAQDLDFAIAAHYAPGSANYTDNTWRPTNDSGAVLTGSDIDNATNTGFPSLGSPPIFEGNGHTINNFYSRSGGLFSEVSSGNIVRNVGVTNIYVQGSGGLAGNNNGRIIASYATGTVNGGGGLVGLNIGTIMASYASVAVSGELITFFSDDDSATGGLVGRNNGTIIASYATGAVVNIFAASSRPLSAISFVGGLVGLNRGTITASYATGNVSSSRVGFFESDLGNLVGRSSGSGATVTDSYASSSPVVDRNTGTVSGGGVTTLSNLDEDNTPTSWALGAWDFGSSSQTPALKYADYDGVGTEYSCSNYPSTSPTLICGTTLLGGQR